MLSSQVHTSLREDTAIYAEISLLLESRALADKSFTYEIPDYLKNSVFIGSLVLVPFGNRELVAGFVVGVKDNVDFQCKPVIDLLSESPLFNDTYFKLLSWMAQYYCTPLSNVISTAIAKELVTKTKRVVRLNDDYTANFNAANEAEDLIIQTLVKSKKNTISLLTLRKKIAVSSSHFYKHLNNLKKKGLILISEEEEKAHNIKTKRFLKLDYQAANTAKQKSIVQELGKRGGILEELELINIASTTRATLAKMVQAGVLAYVETEVIRDPLKHVTYKDSEKIIPTLTEEQKNVYAVLENALQRHLETGSTATTKNNSPDIQADFKPYLLFGVTGSGKTEIYFRLIDQALSAGKTAIYLLPEISLTPQLSRRLLARFGDKVAIFHSGLSSGERYDTLRRVARGDAKVLLGARSAVLAHMPNLGLIILDEEHDSSYKQSSPAPRYHARDVAIKRGQLENALVVLGSATPDLQSYSQALKDKHILYLKNRVFNQSLPEIILVDMKAEWQSGNKSLFSRDFLNLASASIEQKEQVIILINRRGYASQVFCMSCGYVLRCAHCSISLVQHISNKGYYLACHHCGFHQDGLSGCPSCKSPFMRQLGLGTQRIEEEIQNAFPDAKVLRMDSDISSKRGAQELIMSKFANGEADILIGTQMVAKGLDIHNVTTVGVLSADSLFNLPDFRSAERGFQLLTQVSGRAGRGHKEGKVVWQLYSNCIQPIQFALNHDYENFAITELESRVGFSYPPYSQLIRLIISSTDNELALAQVERLAEELSSVLEDSIEPDKVIILGPSPCLIEKLKGLHRHQILIKNLAGEPGHRLITQYLKSKEIKDDLRLAIDIDPYDLL